MLKEFDLDAPKAGREKRSDFRYQTRCMTALIERLYEPKVKTERQWKFTVEIVPKIQDKHVRDLYDVYAVESAYDVEQFFSLDTRQKKEQALRWLKEGIDIACKELQWPRAPFERAFDKAEELDYRNEWVWKKPKTSPDRKHTAEIFCIHEVEEFTITMIIKDRKTNDTVKQKILTTTEPDDHIFKNRLGRLQWTSNENAELIDYFGKKRWKVKI